MRERVRWWGERENQSGEIVRCEVRGKLRLVRRE